MHFINSVIKTAYMYRIFACVKTSELALNNVSISTTLAPRRYCKVVTQKSRISCVVSLTVK